MIFLKNNLLLNSYNITTIIKTCTIILIIAVISILILNNLYIYKELDNVYQGIEFSVNDSEYEKITVTLKGS